MSPWPQANTVLSPFHGLYSQWSRDFMWPQRSFVTWEPGRHYPHFLEKETGIPPPPSPIFFFFLILRRDFPAGGGFALIVPYVLSPLPPPLKPPSQRTSLSCYYRRGALGQSGEATCPGSHIEARAHSALKSGFFLRHLAESFHDTGPRKGFAKVRGRGWGKELIFVEDLCYGLGFTNLSI